MLCKHENVVSHLTIQDREQNILKIEFIGNVKHDITKPKVTKMLGEQHATAIQEYERTNTTPSKYHRDKLELQVEAFQAANYSGDGVLHPLCHGCATSVCKIPSCSYCRVHYELPHHRFNTCNVENFEREGSVLNVSCYPTPAVVMTDFSMAIIKACIREFTNENVEDYLTRGFNIINGDASREDAEKTFCAVHMLKLNKFHVKKLYGKGETGSSKVHIANVFLWSIVVLLFNTLGDDKFCLPWISHFLK